jgi:hypothetical protein
LSYYNFFFGANGRELQRKKKNISVTSLLGAGVSILTWLLFPENRGTPYPLTRVNLSIGELYSVVTNKTGKKYTNLSGTLKAGTVINHLHTGSSYKRNQVEITLGLANSMQLISRKVFLKAKQVTDRFQFKSGAMHPNWLRLTLTKKAWFGKAW